ncbi:unnamed protein product [Allacma fusca]|uniref:Uncharacterized protein n=1 Tax=Allacma fusca TaxID=39272 RepID=A0A8J2J1Z7_9HEXA|nr:unnamed protein product [Allacma fusca]
MSQNNGEPSPPAVSNRRDENSISFRHFLQAHSDVVPTRHRNSRGANAGSVDLVDGASMALPDFVQDHLIVESIISASGGSGTSDIPETVGVQNSQHIASGGNELSPAPAYPEYPPSQCSRNYMSKRNRRQAESNVPISDCPAGCSSSQGPVTLPDFLSDGPMLFSANKLTDGGIPDSSTSPTNRTSNSAREGVNNSGTSLLPVRPASSRESETLSQQNDRLRRELTEKNRRLSQLENDLQRHRNETSMFEAAYLNSEQTLQATTRRALAAEARIAELNHELQFLKNQLTDRLGLKRRGQSDRSSPLHTVISEASSITQNGRYNSNVESNRIVEIAYSAEYLAGELMGQLNALKLLALDSTRLEGDHAVTSSQKKPASKDDPNASKQTIFQTDLTSLHRHPVNGILLKRCDQGKRPGKGGGDGSNVTLGDIKTNGSESSPKAAHVKVSFQDVIPCLHMNKYVTPMMELALAQIDRYCKAENYEVAGYYQANQNLYDNSPDFVAQRIADKLSEVNPNSVVLMVNNDKLNSNLECAPFSVYQLQDGKLKLQDSKIRLLPDDQGALSTASALIQAKAYRYLHDFDNHLDNLTVNYWVNPEVNDRIQQLSS